jgi:hypothetical protein
MNDDMSDIAGHNLIAAHVDKSDLVVCHDERTLTCDAYGEQQVVIQGSNNFIPSKPEKMSDKKIQPLTGMPSKMVSC